MHPTFSPSDERQPLSTEAFEAAGDRQLATTPTRILVVDDEPLIADTIVQILNRNGFIATAAYGGREAIDCARLTSPELILSDVLMPHIDGVEAAITIQKFLPATRIVLFSGQAATVEILARARSRGYHFELLAKPLHPTQLIKHLRQDSEAG
jgi:CheY-like chemotaxis protein